MAGAKGSSDFLHCTACSTENLTNILVMYQFLLLVSFLCYHMDFTKYKSDFSQAAKEKGYDEDEIISFLQYASGLYNKGLPIIYDQEHLALLVGFDYYCCLLPISNWQVDFYKKYEIPKKNGGVRIIEEPYPALKEIQTWILRNILEPAALWHISPVAKAFIPKKNLRENARFHRQQDVVVALDLHDFFGSIKAVSIYQLFRKFGYHQSVSMMLTKLCTLKNSLPQGAPTSPMLSNLVFYELDKKIFRYCQARNIRYTRYADDMTFSGKSFSVSHLITYIRMVVGTKHYKLNDEKTNVMKKGCCQKVTGVVVNDKLQVSKSYRDKVRQEVYYCIKYGVASHMRKISLPNWITSPTICLHHLLGKVNFVLQINPNDKKFLEYRKSLHDLLLNYN